VSAGSDADVKNLSETISKGEGVAFDDFYKEQSYELEETFPVDKKTVTSMVKFSGMGAGVSISFERKHLGERIYYNEHSDTLTIQGVPPNLKDQLKKYLSESDS
jgi:nucleoid-associated protein